MQWQQPHCFELKCSAGLEIRFSRGAGTAVAEFDSQPPYRATHNHQIKGVSDASGFHWHSYTYLNMLRYTHIHNIKNKNTQMKSLTPMEELMSNFYLIPLLSHLVLQMELQAQVLALSASPSQHSCPEQSLILILHSSRYFSFLINFV